MCALVANEPAKQQWLRSAGILQVLYRLTLGMQQRSSDSTDEEEDEGEEGVSSALGQHLSRSLQRQVARLLAILSADERALVCTCFPYSWKHHTCESRTSTSTYKPLSMSHSRTTSTCA